MAADDESADVVGSPVAAAIERRLPGRAVARIGPQELVPFQSAYVGGHTLADVQAPMVGVRLFGFDHDTAVEAERRVVVPPDHPSDLQRLVATHRAAFGLLGAPPPRRPWLPSLAPSYELGRLPRVARRPAIVLGVRDEPARQLQSLAHFRPDADGGLLVLGTGGAGKTVALRSIAISAGLAAEASGQPVEVHALDFAGRGLDVLERAAPRRLGHRRRRHRAGDPAAAHAARAHRPAGRRVRRRAGLVAARVPPHTRPTGRRRAGSFVLLDSYAGFQAMHERVDGRPLARPVHAGSSPTAARSACTS